MDWSKKAQETLTEKRFLHTKNVVEMAIKLAEFYGANKEEVEVAAWMHDLFKEEKIDFQRQLASKYDKIFLEAPKTILHGPACAQYYKKEINSNIANAIAFHSTGNKEMSLEAKIVFLADYISIERTHKHVEQIRNLAFANLDEALIACLEQMINYLQANKKEVFSYTKTFLEELNNE